MSTSCSTRAASTASTSAGLGFSEASRKTMARRVLSSGVPAVRSRRSIAAWSVLPRVSRSSSALKHASSARLLISSSSFPLW